MPLYRSIERNNIPAHGPRSRAWKRGSEGAREHRRRQNVNDWQRWPPLRNPSAPRTEITTIGSLEAAELAAARDTRTWPRETLLAQRELAGAPLWLLISSLVCVAVFRKLNSERESEKRKAKSEKRKANNNNKCAID